MTKKDLADPIGVEKWVKYYENLGTKVIVADLNDDNDIKKTFSICPGYQLIFVEFCKLLSFIIITS